MRILDLESHLESRVIRYAEQEYQMLQFKLTPAGQKGWMDRLFITKTGIHFYIEFKRQGEKLQKLQEYRRWQLQQRQCNVHGPVDNWDQAKAIVDYYGTVPVPETEVGSP